MATLPVDPPKWLVAFVARFGLLTPPGECTVNGSVDIFVFDVLYLPVPGMRIGYMENRNKRNI